jgi:hypothetical protein
MDPIELIIMAVKFLPASSAADTLNSPFEGVLVIET